VTRRAIITGFTCGVLIAGFGYLNDWVFRLNHIAGNHFPISVFGGLAVFSLAVNPLLRRLFPKAALGGKELAVVVALTLVGCTIPGSGLMREFTQVMALPAHFERTTPGWQREKALSYAPEALLVNGGRYDEDITGAYVAGEYGSKHLLNFRAVPWEAWLRPLAVWVPLLMLTAAATVCLSLIVHPEWSRRELLPYPVVAFGRAIIAGRAPGDTRPLVRTKAFWTGFGLVFGIHVVDGLYGFFPEVLIYVPRWFDFTPLVRLWPEVTRGAGWWLLFAPRLYPTVVAFAFFLSSEVSLSLGLSQVGAVVISAVLLGYGIDLQAYQPGTGVASWQMFGSAAGMAAVILYVGRHHYLRVGRFAFFPPTGPRATQAPEPYAVWACRGLLLTSAGLTGMLIWLGLDWPLAVLLVVLLLLLAMVTARISAETGLPHIECNWSALGVMLGLFGTAALGPKAIVLVGLVCAMLMVDVRETLMPYVTNGLKLCDDEKVTAAGVAWRGALVFAAGLCLAVPVVLAANYTHGAPLVDGWGSWCVPRFAFDKVAEASLRLEAMGQLAASQALAPWQRLTAMEPQTAFLWAAGLGAGAVLLCSFLRLRFERWPLHPVMFLAWGTWPLMCFSPSFLLGWAAKKLVTRFGGHGLHVRAMPFLIGVIAGDILGGLLFMAVGAVYYAISHQPAPGYYAFPE
jgi:hypothetical protein